MIMQIELGPVVIRHPHQTTGDARRAAQRDKNGGPFFAISYAIPQSAFDTRIVANPTHNLLAHPIAECLSLMPRMRMTV